MKTLPLPIVWVSLATTETVVSITFRRIPIAGEAVVLTFDMCSSTDLLEEFTLRGDLERYKAFLTELKRHLADAQKKVDFDPYKFTGDGWISLFPGATDGQLIWNFIIDLVRYYHQALRATVRPYLGSRPPLEGLTFGVECGPIYKVTMFQRWEYVGRPIVVACRLQSAVKSYLAAPADKAFVSPSVKERYFRGIEGARSRQKRIELHNVRDGREFRAHVINLRPNMAFNRTPGHASSFSPPAAPGAG